MDNPLSKLALDYWYKVLMAIGASVFILSGTGVLSAFPTASTALVSLGVFFAGLGEWANHPLQTKIHPLGVIRGHPRNPCSVGVAFDILGVCFLAFGSYKFFA